jgi:hypothetical protein
MSEEPREDLWMLDLDERGLPWRAHLIVQDDGKTRTTACGERVTEWSHPRGWWGCKPGTLPLARPETIHCRWSED